jgi:hypothetical protein
VTVESYETPVDDYREQLYVLASKVEGQCDLIEYDLADRLDWLDLQRVAHNLAGFVHEYVQGGEEEAYAAERRKAKR